MDTPKTDTAFAGSIPKLYDTLLVPLIFEVLCRGDGGRGWRRSRRSAFSRSPPAPAW